MRPLFPPQTGARRRGIAALVIPLLVTTAAIATAPAAVAAPMPRAVMSTDTGTGEVDIMAYVYDVRFVGWAASVYGEVTAVDPVDGAPTGTVRVISHEPGEHTEEETLLGDGFFYSDAYPTEVGTRQFTVEYSGDENFAPTSETFDYDVPYGPDTATTLTADPAGPITVGETITFTARVTDSQGRPLGRPDAEISFYDNGEFLAGEQVQEGWVATITTSSLSVGTHRITAETLSGFHEPSTSNEVIVEVLPAEQQSVRGSLWVSHHGVVPSGTTVHAVAEFHPRSGSGMVDGWVQFYDWRTKVGGPVELVDGKAHFSYGALDSGPHLLIARYLGTDAYSPALTIPRFVYVRR